MLAGGVPEITGGRFVVVVGGGGVEVPPVAVVLALTVIANAGKLALLRPSVAEIRTPEYVPTWLFEGTPDSLPLRQSKLAHVGLFRIRKKRRVLRPPETVGENV